MSKKKDAKTASKNAPTNRQKALEFTYNGQRIVPIMFYGKSGDGFKKYMAAQIHGKNELVLKNGSPLRWDVAINEKN